MRQVVLDTETTGLEVRKGHRVIEIGCVELLERQRSGRTFHTFLNPDRAKAGCWSAPTPNNWPVRVHASAWSGHLRPSVFIPCIGGL